MKNIIKLAIFLTLSCEAIMADGAPKEMADVVGRTLSDSVFPLFSEFGHVALYDSNKDSVLEVTNKYPAIQDATISSITQPMGISENYWGARYGIGDTSQHYNVLRAGNAQKDWRPLYVYTPYYTEGKWVQKWMFSWRKGWYVKWIKQRAKFRCDSFVNYCYDKAIGQKLIRSVWATTPKNIFKALPKQR